MVSIFFIFEYSFKFYGLLLKASFKEYIVKLYMLIFSNICIPCYLSIVEIHKDLHYFLFVYIDLIFKLKHVVKDKRTEIEKRLFSQLCESKYLNDDSK